VIKDIIVILGDDFGQVHEAAIIVQGAGGKQPGFKKIRVKLFKIFQFPPTVAA